MDSYDYSLDPYRQTSASYYAPRYPPAHDLDRRSSFGIPPAYLLSPHTRVPLDPYTPASGAPPATFHPPSSAPRAPTSPVFRTPHPRPAPRQKGSRPPMLGNAKKFLNHSENAKVTVEKKHPSKQDAQKNPSQNAKINGRPVPLSRADSLAKETQELHKIFRADVPVNPVKKQEGNKANDKSATKKRKAETQVQKPATTKGRNSVKKQKGRKRENPSKDLKEEMVELREPILPSEEICRHVREFLGVTEHEEETKGADVSEIEVKEKPSEDTEKSPKLEETQQTPEQKKEIESNSFKFFSTLLEEHKDLRDYFIENCYSGAFRCLVCHTIYTKNTIKGKLFSNLVSLVVHTQMCKRRQPEHAGYGRSVSAVLGWDYQKLPKVPKGDRRAISTAKSIGQVEEKKRQEVDTILDKDKKEAESITEGQDQGVVSENPPPEDMQEK